MHLRESYIQFHNSTNNPSNNEIILKPGGRVGETMNPSTEMVEAKDEGDGQDCGTG